MALLTLLTVPCCRGSAGAGVHESSWQERATPACLWLQLERQALDDAPGAALLGGNVQQNIIQTYDLVEGHSKLAGCPQI
jgi:hypothetical protein